MKTQCAKCDRTPLERFADLEGDIPELLMYAKIGKRFYDIAYQFMTSACAVCTKEATAYPHVERGLWRWKSLRRTILFPRSR